MDEALKKEKKSESNRKYKQKNKEKMIEII